MKKLLLVFICLLPFAVNSYSQVPVIVGPRPDIVAVEYFFDTDPGQGNGTRVNFTGDSLISESFNADISGLSVGRHLLYARTLDENGKWSFTSYINTVFKTTPNPTVSSLRPDIVAVEYFFDADPGQGNGIRVNFTGDSLISESFNADISGLSVGRHLLYARMLDENGKWSHANYITTIFKAAPAPVVIGPRPDIVAVEYFFDNDPGPGNGTVIYISADSLISESFNADISGLPWGKHLLYARTLNENRQWSHTNYITTIFKAAQESPIIGPRPDIVAIEYFFDTDPGQGNGIPITFDPDSIVDVSFMLDLSSLDIGDHLVYIRALDETGRWSFVDVNEISKRIKRLLRHGQFFLNNEKQAIVKPQ